MNKQTIFISVAVSVLLCSCQSSTVKITGRFVGSGARNVYLEQVSPLEQTIIDSVTLEADGAYRFEMHDVDKTPSLYNILYNNERIPLLLGGGDRLTVSSVGSVIRNYTVEGSEESELLRGFYQNYVAGLQRLDGLMQAIGRPGIADGERQQLIRDYTAEYYRIRREQLRFIVENRSSLAAVYALYQRLPGEAYLFNGDSDVVYYRTVAEALEQSYPRSSYLPALHAEIARMDARIKLASTITESGFPDIEMPDMYGRKIRLSSLKGKVVLLDFWSAEAGNSNVLNAEMKEIYRKYAESPTGFEIYQISLDTSKPAWIDAVQEQQLPWISVCDFRGRATAAVGLYNVQQIPSNYLIDREGTIVAKNLYGKSLEERLDQLTR